MSRVSSDISVIILRNATSNDPHTGILWHVIAVVGLTAIALNQQPRHGHGEDAKAGVADDLGQGAVATLHHLAHLVAEIRRRGSIFRLVFCYWEISPATLAINDDAPKLVYIFYHTYRHLCHREANQVHFPSDMAAKT